MSRQIFDCIAGTLYLFIHLLLCAKTTLHRLTVFGGIVNVTKYIRMAQSNVTLSPSELLQITRFNHCLYRYTCVGEACKNDFFLVFNVCTLIIFFSFVFFCYIKIHQTITSGQTYTVKT